MTTTGTARRDAHCAIAPGNASASWITTTVGANSSSAAIRPRLRRATL